MSIHCPKCQADLPDDAVFCDQCGASIIGGPPAAAPAAGSLVDSVLCPQCGEPAIPGEAFCDSCGASLAQPQVAEMPMTETAPEEDTLPPVAPLAPSRMAPEPPAADGLTLCPSCHAENLPGSRFCSNCGLRMDAPGPVVPELAEEANEEQAAEPEPELELPEAIPVAEAPAPTGQPRFIIRDTGAEIALPTAEGDYIIGREDPVSGVFPAVDMNPHEGEQLGVSRRHAQLTVEAGLTFIQDLDSTNFTFVNRKKIAPHTPAALSNGDEVRLGKLVMTYLE